MASRRARVLVLALMKERVLYDCYDQLLDSMRTVATVTLVETKSDFFRKFRSSKPSVVLPVDSAISFQENNDVLRKLIGFVQEGGIVVCCCNFSNNLKYDQAQGYFQSWGLPWDVGSYHRTTVHRNQHPDSVVGMSLEGLPASYSLKSLLLLHVPAHQAIYNPSPSSRIESRVFPPDAFPVNPAEAPCAYAPIGQGYFGYVGDVNGEDGSTRVVMAMSHFPQDAVVPDTNPRQFSVQISPEGVVTEPTPEETSGLVVFSDAIRQAGENMQIGNRSEIRLPPGNTPPPNHAPFASSPGPTARNPPRPREAEVEARALKRAVDSMRKTREAEAFKEQGNELYRRGDNHGAIQLYKKAVAVRGPRPTYQANIAAAYMKLEMWLEAEEACEEALKRDPKHLKARYRRGLARLAMCHFRDAMNDFKACAALAPREPLFLEQISKTRQEYAALKATGNEYANVGVQDLPTEEEEQNGDDAHFAPALDSLPIEIPSESDSSDFEHEGNGTPCRFYNHNGCNKGSQCKFKHAPTKDTTRDELGRNVCDFFLHDKCKFGDKCHFAHSKEYIMDRKR